MRAYWTDDNVHISVQELRVHGVDYVRLDSMNYQASLNRMKADNQYIHEDVFEFTSETPDLDAVLAKFGREHTYKGDIVYCVIAGSGILDIRSNNDDWMRVEIATLDCIAVPANRYRQFFIKEDNNIRCIRLLKATSNVTPVYRPRSEVALA